MKKFLLLWATLLFIAAANAQTSHRPNVQDAHDRYTHLDSALKAQYKSSGKTSNAGKAQTVDSAKKTLAVPQRTEGTGSGAKITRKAGSRAASPVKQ